jgi:hypothetical protein
MEKLATAAGRSVPLTRLVPHNKRFEWLDLLQKDVADGELSRLTFLLGYEMSGSVNSKSGIVWKSQKTLGLKIGVDDPKGRTVRRVIARMEKSGFLHKRRRGRGMTNNYILAWPSNSGTRQESQRTSRAARERTPRSAQRSNDRTPASALGASISVPTPERTPVSVQSGAQGPPISLIDDLATPFNVQPIAALEGARDSGHKRLSKEEPIADLSGSLNSLENAVKLAARSKSPTESQGVAE